MPRLFFSRWAGWGDGKTIVLVEWCYTLFRRKGDMVFSWYIVCYLFVAGVGGGAFLIAFVAGLYDLRKGSARSASILSAAQSGFRLAPVLALISVLLLFLDLEQPQRVFFLIIRPFGSVMGVGAWSLFLFALLSGLLVLTDIWKLKVGERMRLAIGSAAAACVTVVIVYTGVLLSSIPSVDLWRTPLLVILFALSSVSTGGAAILVWSSLVGTPAPCPVRRMLWNRDDAVLAIEALALVCFVTRGLMAGGMAAESAKMLLTGTAAPWFWFGVVIVGFLMTGACRVIGHWVGETPAVLMASVSVLIAGFALRYCIVASGLYSPLVLSPVFL